MITVFHAVQRQRFLPGRDLAKAYSDETIVTKSDERGAMLYAISQPTIVATQLDQLGVQPGHKVLEAGAATGYNAAEPYATPLLPWTSKSPYSPGPEARHPK